MLSSYVYDDNGNRIAKKDNLGAVIQSYSLNPKNRIASITTTSDVHNFQYDSRGYRVEKQATAIGTRRYYLEAEHLEAVYDQNNILKEKYLRGAVVDELVNGYHYNSANPDDWTNYTYHHDQLRSVTALSGHDGVSIQTTEYGPFGEQIAGTGSSSNAMQYTGREADAELGLYYYRARYYDPEVGRFLTEDPMGLEAGINFYVYCANNPVNCTDPSGKITLNQTLGGLRAVGGGVEAAVGVVTLASTGWTGLGAVVGGAVTLHGLDQVQAGLRQYHSDSNVPSFTSQVLQQFGLPPLAADLADASFSFAAGGISIMQGARSLSTHAADPLAEGLNAYQLTMRVEYGSQALNKLDALEYGAKKNTALAVANMMDNGVNQFGSPYAKSTTLVERLTTSPSLADTGFTPLANFILGSGAAASGGVSAAGGFVLYPSKPNTNMMSNLYSK